MKKLSVKAKYRIGIRMFGFMDREEALSIETLLQLFWDTRDGEAFIEKLMQHGFVQSLEVSIMKSWCGSFTGAAPTTFLFSTTSHNLRWYRCPGCGCVIGLRAKQ